MPAAASAALSPSCLISSHCARASLQRCEVAGSSSSPHALKNHGSEPQTIISTSVRRTVFARRRKYLVVSGEVMPPRLACASRISKVKQCSPCLPTLSEKAVGCSPWTVDGFVLLLTNRLVVMCRSHKSDLPLHILVLVRSHHGRERGRRS